MIATIFLILSAAAFLCKAIKVNAETDFDAWGKCFFVIAVIAWKGLGF